MASDGSDVARKYERLGAGYGRVSTVVDRTAVNRTRAELLARADGDVLEIAVGTGANLRHYPAGIHLTGLDFAAKAVAAASKRAESLGIDWTPIVGDAESIALPDASVDTVVCTLAGCTFARPEVVFAEIRRVLKPGGQALFLEHVRPAGRAGRIAVRSIKPLTKAALGCSPDRDTEATIITAGFTTEVLARPLRGLFVSLRATLA